jgi:hypothetical protein
LLRLWVVPPWQRLKAACYPVRGSSGRTAAIPAASWQRTLRRFRGWGSDADGDWDGRHLLGMAGGGTEHRAPHGTMPSQELAESELEAARMQLLFKEEALQKRIHEVGPSACLHPPPAPLHLVGRHPQQELGTSSATTSAELLGAQGMD